MNKKILTVGAAVAMATASAFAEFTVWNADGGEQVLTGLENDTETQGYWFDYGDSKDGGASAVAWPVEKGNAYDDNSMEPIIAECGGVCGDITLAKGSITYDPFVGIGFNVVGETSATDNTPVAGDASAWGGVCITYISDLAPVLELGLGDDFDKSLGYDNPAAKLAKATESTTMDIAWAAFKQAGWGKGGKITGAEAAAQLVAIKFKVQAKDGSTGHFNIQSVGPYQGGCVAAGGSSPSIGIKGVRSVANAKAMLSNRTLSFAGISSNATAEVINLQGQIVMKGVVSSASSLDLSSLDAGIYMVRVAGKSVDFSSKIVLK